MKQEAQLSLKEAHCNLYSFCCSRPTDFQDYPRSMIFISSDRAYGFFSDQ